MKKYSVGSLFAGVDGIFHAFKNVSCEVLWANEIDVSTCKTCKLNNAKIRLLVS